MPRRTKRRLPWFVGAGTILSILMIALLAEIWLRRSERFANYAERNGFRNPPLSKPEKLREPYLRLHPRNARVKSKRTEFTREFQSNEEGLSGNLFPEAKAKGEFRILGLGDSFTEGVGDVEGLGYIGRLERLLPASSGPRSYRFMNAGVSGSDPVFCLELLRRRLLKYKPDLVLLGINSSDPTDVVARGGLDRYTPDGYLKNALPWWSEIFNASHLVRAFLMGWLHLDWRLQSPPEQVRSLETAVSEIVRAAVAVKDLGKENGFRLLVLVQPSGHEVAKAAFDGAIPSVEAGLRQQGVETANLMPTMVSLASGRPLEEYDWPRDGHYKPDGYQYFAQAVLVELQKRGLATSR